MKSLVIAEKPSVARDIARVLGANQKNGGILEGKNYVVTWALGHLVTLADPEEYDRKYEKWEMATLPMLPKEMKLVVIRQTGRQFSVVKPEDPPDCGKGEQSRFPYCDHWRSGSS